jgi:hypothetical protein
MATNSQYLNGQLSDAQIEQLIQSLRGIKPVENDILDEEKSVNKEKMASYAEILKDDGKEHENTNTNTNTKSNSSSEKVKPVFLKDEDVFGSSMKPARSLWLTNVEIYKAIGVRVPSQCIKGIQRIRDMWRIYMDNEADRLSLLVQGLVLRGRQIPLHSQNPYNPGRTQPDTIRIKVKNVPLSADDGQIHRALTLEGCEIQGLFRERLRVDGKLTNCETGDRLIISKTLKNPIPRKLQIGKYWALVFHSGQPEFSTHNQQNNNTNRTDKVPMCYKCLSPGHFLYDCTNDWVCKACHKTGHKMMDCPNKFTEDECEAQDHNTEDSNTDVETDTVQNTTTVEIHNTTQEGESTTDDIEQLQSVQKVTFSKTDSTKNSKASGKKNTMKHGQKTMETFLKTPVSHGPKQTVRSHTPPTPPDRQDDQTNKSNGSKKAKV